MTTAAPPGQPATPAEALRTAAERMAENGFAMRGGLICNMLRRWADELDAAPATYTLPAEPGPEVTELWGHGTASWFERMPGGWRAKADEHGEYSTISWLDVLVAQRRLSTVPPAGTEPADDCLRTAAEVRARGRERCDHCAYPAGAHDV